MHAVFLLAGLGTMLLGPILPLLSQRWRLTDSQSGLLIAAQFIGATLGGLTVSKKLQRDLLLGLAAAALGFLAFAFAPGLAIACTGLLIGGFGVGRIIATVNIIAGSRYTHNRGSALSRLNFTWSFGSLLSPLLAAWLVKVPLGPRLAGFAILFSICAVVLVNQFPTQPAYLDSSEATLPADAPLPPRIFLYFAALLLLYGGLETCLSAWLTTYALRYGQTSLVLSQYTLVLLLCGLTAGRAISAALLLKMRDTTLQRLSLALAAVLAAALALAHQPSFIAIFAVLLGVCLAPIFPATFAILMARRPSASQAGIVIAASGIGAAILPALMGLISAHTGSLQLALTLPVAAALAMLTLTIVPIPSRIT